MQASSGTRQAHCMQEQVRVSSTERIVVSSPCSVTLRSSTSTCAQQHPGTKQHAAEQLVPAGWC